MVSRETITILAELSKTNYANALLEVINEHKSKIEDIRTCKPEDLEARKLALLLIDDIFKFLLQEKVALVKKNQYT